jgi:hypothetical protein
LASSPTTNVLLETTISRLGSWLKSLEREFENARVARQDQNDIGAVNYLNVLQAVLERYRYAYERYRAQTAVAPGQRLLWLQDVGAGLAYLENLVGRLSVPIAPTLTPMLASFSRLLEALVPNRPPIFRPVRDFNYELEEFHSDQFLPLLTSSFSWDQWPILFITLPTGILDSPRSHVLVAHEIGHAIAAVSRENFKVYEAACTQASADGTSPPAAPPAFLPLPSAPSADVLRIAIDRWTEQGYPAPQITAGAPLTTEGEMLVGLVATVGAELDEQTEYWLEELFSDAVGACLFGPAFLVSFLEVLLTTGSMDRGSSTHPPLAARLHCIGKALRHAELGFTSDSFPPNLRERFETAMVEADAVLLAPPLTKGSEARFADVMKNLVLGRTDEIVTTAVALVKKGNALYTAAQFKADIDKHLTLFVQTGVPPIAERTSLASVFNVGQVLCSDHLDSFCPGVDDIHAKEQRVDDLLLKAIELNEIAAAWREA